MGTESRNATNEPCPACEGRGRYDWSTTCAKCDGTGFITVFDPPLPGPADPATERERDDAP